MNIKERLVRQSPDDKIEIGRIVRQAYNGKFGEIIRAVINGRTTQEVIAHQFNPNDRAPLHAERILGRIEGYNNVLLDLERMISEGEQYSAYKEPEESKDIEQRGTE